jgi:hypothetical protein
VSRRRTLATVLLCSGDFKLYFDTSHITPLQLVIELRGLEQRVCVKYFKLGKTITETFQTYGEGCLSPTQCYKWYRRFKSGRTSIEDDHIEKVRSVIRENRRLTVHEVSEVGICKSSCHTILTEKLKMHRVAAKFVPRLLTGTKTEPRHSQSGAIRSFEHW